MRLAPFCDWGLATALVLIVALGLLTLVRLATQ